MTPSPRRFFSGDTESQAVIEAAGHFGLRPGELAYRTLEKKHGFLRRQRVVIEVDPTCPRRAVGAVEPPPAARRPPAPVSEPRPRAEAVDDRQAEEEPRGASQEGTADPEGVVSAAEALVALAGLSLSATGAEDGPAGEEVLKVELRGAHRDLLLARQGELLRACEYVLRRMVRDLPPGGLSLDSEGFREERDTHLRQQAAAAAAEVRSTGCPVLLEPLPAAERRIVHLTIQQEQAVASRSEGEGELRRVRIELASAGAPAGEV